MKVDAVAEKLAVAPWPELWTPPPNGALLKANVVLEMLTFELP